MVAHDVRDVFLALPQGRDVQRQHAEAVIQILAEQALFTMAYRSRFVPR
jgi:hypothetical protein